MTRAIAPVAAEIMAGRPPTMAMVTAMVNEANNPTRGSTPAMMEKEMASGMSARATTRPANTSVLSRRGDLSAARTEASLASRSCGACESCCPDKTFRSDSNRGSRTRELLSTARGDSRVIAKIVVYDPRMGRIHQTAAARKLYFDAG
jgi:hypothetical protein